MQPNSADTCTDPSSGKVVAPPTPTAAPTAAGVTTTQKAAKPWRVDIRNTPPTGNTPLEQRLSLQRAAGYSGAVTLRYKPPSPVNVELLRMAGSPMPASPYFLTKKTLSGGGVAKQPPPPPAPLPSAAHAATATVVGPPPTTTASPPSAAVEATVADTPTNRSNPSPAVADTAAATTGSPAASSSRKSSSVLIPRRSKSSSRLSEDIKTKESTTKENSPRRRGSREGREESNRVAITEDGADVGLTPADKKTSSLLSEGNGDGKAAAPLHPKRTSSKRSSSNSRHSGHRGEVGSPTTRRRRSRSSSQHLSRSNGGREEEKEEDKDKDNKSPRSPRSSTAAKECDAAIEDAAFEERSRIRRLNRQLKFEGKLDDAARKRRIEEEIAKSQETIKAVAAAEKEAMMAKLAKEDAAKREERHRKRAERQQQRAEDAVSGAEEYGVSLVDMVDEDMGVTKKSKTLLPQQSATMDATKTEKSEPTAVEKKPLIPAANPTLVATESAEEKDTAAAIHVSEPLTASSAAQLKGTESSSAIDDSAASPTATTAVASPANINHHVVVVTPRHCADLASAYDVPSDDDADGEYGAVTTSVTVETPSPSGVLGVPSRAVSDLTLPNAVKLSSSLSSAAPPAVVAADAIPSSPCADSNGSNGHTTAPAHSSSTVTTPHIDRHRECEQQRKQPSALPILSTRTSASFWGRSSHKGKETATPAKEEKAPTSSSGAAPSGSTARGRRFRPDMPLTMRVVHVSSQDPLHAAEHVLNPLDRRTMWRTQSVVVGEANKAAEEEETAAKKKGRRMRRREFEGGSRVNVMSREEAEDNYHLGDSSSSSEKSGDEDDRRMQLQRSGILTPPPVASARDSKVPSITSPPQIPPSSAPPPSPSHQQQLILRFDGTVALSSLLITLGAPVGEEEAGRRRSAAGSSSSSDAAVIVSRVQVYTASLYDIPRGGDNNNHSSSAAAAVSGGDSWDVYGGPFGDAGGGDGTGRGSRPLAAAAIDPRQWYPNLDGALFKLCTEAATTTAGPREHNNHSDDDDNDADEHGSGSDDADRSILRINLPMNDAREKGREGEKRGACSDVVFLKLVFCTEAESVNGDKQTASPRATAVGSHPLSVLGISAFGELRHAIPFPTWYGRAAPTLSAASPMLSKVLGAKRLITGEATLPAMATAAMGRSNRGRDAGGLGPLFIPATKRNIGGGNSKLLSSYFAAGGGRSTPPPIPSHQQAFPTSPTHLAATHSNSVPTLHRPWSNPTQQNGLLGGLSESAGALSSPTRGYASYSSPSAAFTPFSPNANANPNASPILAWPGSPMSIGGGGGGAQRGGIPSRFNQQQHNAVASNHHLPSMKNRGEQQQQHPYFFAPSDSSPLSPQSPLHPAPSAIVAASAAPSPSKKSVTIRQQQQQERSHQQHHQLQYHLQDPKKLRCDINAANLSELYDLKAQSIWEDNYRLSAAVHARLVALGPIMTDIAELQQRKLLAIERDDWRRVREVSKAIERKEAQLADRSFLGAFGYVSPEITSAATAAAVVVGQERMRREAAAENVASPNDDAAAQQTINSNGRKKNSTAARSQPSRSSSSSSSASNSSQLRRQQQEEQRERADAEQAEAAAAMRRDREERERQIKLRKRQQEDEEEELERELAVRRRKLEMADAEEAFALRMRRLREEESKALERQQKQREEHEAMLRREEEKARAEAEERRRRWAAEEEKEERERQATIERRRLAAAAAEAEEETKRLFTRQQRLELEEEVRQRELLASRELSERETLRILYVQEEKEETMRAEQRLKLEDQKAKKGKRGGHEGSGEIREVGAGDDKNEKGGDDDDIALGSSKSLIPYVYSEFDETAVGKGQGGNQLSEYPPGFDPTEILKKAAEEEEKERREKAEREALGLSPLKSGSNSRSFSPLRSAKASPKKSNAKGNSSSRNRFSSSSSPKTTARAKGKDVVVVEAVSPPAPAVEAAPAQPPSVAAVNAIDNSPPAVEVVQKDGDAAVAPSSPATVPSPLTEEEHPLPPPPSVNVAAVVESQAISEEEAPPLATVDNPPVAPPLSEAAVSTTNTTTTTTANITISSATTASAQAAPVDAMEAVAAKDVASAAEQQRVMPPPATMEETGEAVISTTLQAASNPPAATAQGEPAISPPPLPPATKKKQRRKERLLGNSGVAEIDRYLAVAGVGIESDDEDDGDDVDDASRSLLPRDQRAYSSSISASLLRLYRSQHKTLMDGGMSVNAPSVLELKYDGYGGGGHQRKGSEGGGSASVGVSSPSEASPPTILSPASAEYPHLPTPLAPGWADMVAFFGERVVRYGLFARDLQVRDALVRSLTEEDVIAALIGRYEARNAEALRLPLREANKHHNPSCSPLPSLLASSTPLEQSMPSMVSVTSNGVMTNMTTPLPAEEALQAALVAYALLQPPHQHYHQRRDDEEEKEKSLSSDASPHPSLISGGMGMGSGAGVGVFEVAPAISIATIDMLTILCHMRSRPLRLVLEMEGDRQVRPPGGVAAGGHGYHNRRRRDSEGFSGSFLSALTSRLGDPSARVRHGVTALLVELSALHSLETKKQYKADQSAFVKSQQQQQQLLLQQGVKSGGGGENDPPLADPNPPQPPLDILVSSRIGIPILLAASAKRKQKEAGTLATVPLDVIMTAVCDDAEMAPSALGLPAGSISKITNGSSGSARLLCGRLEVARLLLQRWWADAVNELLTLLKKPPHDPKSSHGPPPAPTPPPPISLPISFSPSLLLSTLLTPRYLHHRSEVVRNGALRLLACYANINGKVALMNSELVAAAAAHADADVSATNPRANSHASTSAPTLFTRVKDAVASDFITMLFDDDDKDDDQKEEEEGSGANGGGDDNANNGGQQRAMRNDSTLAQLLWCEDNFSALKEVSAVEGLSSDAPSASSTTTTFSRLRNLKNKAGAGTNNDGSNGSSRRRSSSLVVGGPTAVMPVDWDTTTLPLYLAGRKESGSAVVDADPSSPSSPSHPIATVGAFGGKKKGKFDDVAADPLQPRRQLLRALHEEQAELLAAIGVPLLKAVDLLAVSTSVAPVAENVNPKNSTTTTPTTVPTRDARAIIGTDDAAVEEHLRVERLRRERGHDGDDPSVGSARKTTTTTTMATAKTAVAKSNPNLKKSSEKDLADAFAEEERSSPPMTTTKRSSDKQKSSDASHAPSSGSDGAVPTAPRNGNTKPPPKPLKSLHVGQQIGGANDPAQVARYSGMIGKRNAALHQKEQSHKTQAELAAEMESFAKSPRKTVAETLKENPELEDAFDFDGKSARTETEHETSNVVVRTVNSPTYGQLRKKTAMASHISPSAVPPPRPTRTSRTPPVAATKTLESDDVPPPPQRFTLNLSSLQQKTDDRTRPAPPPATAAALLMSSSEPLLAEPTAAAKVVPSSTMVNTSVKGVPQRTLSNASLSSNQNQNGGGATPHTPKPILKNTSFVAANNPLAGSGGASASSNAAFLMEISGRSGVGNNSSRAVTFAAADDPSHTTNGVSNSALLTTLAGAYPAVVGSSLTEPALALLENDHDHPRITALDMPSERPPRRQQPRAQGAGYCQFCGEHDELFEERGELLEHFHSECLFLCPCPLCLLPVEIRDVHWHMAEDCAKNVKAPSSSQKPPHAAVGGDGAAATATASAATPSDSGDPVVRQCPKCFEVVANGAPFEEHITANTCHPYDPLRIKCPLCGVTVDRTDAAWEEHITVPPYCSGNPRTISENVSGAYGQDDDRRRADEDEDSRHRRLFPNMNSSFGLGSSYHPTGADDESENDDDDDSWDEEEEEEESEEEDEEDEEGEEEIPHEESRKSLPSRRRSSVKNYRGAPPTANLPAAVGDSSMSALLLQRRRRATLEPSPEVNNALVPLQRLTTNSIDIFSDPLPAGVIATHQRRKVNNNSPSPARQQRLLLSGTLSPNGRRPIDDDHNNSVKKHPTTRRRVLSVTRRTIGKSSSPPLTTPSATKMDRSNVLSTTTRTTTVVRRPSGPEDGGNVSSAPDDGKRKPRKFVVTRRITLVKTMKVPLLLEGGVGGGAANMSPKAVGNVRRSPSPPRRAPSPGAVVVKTRQHPSALNATLPPASTNNAAAGKKKSLSPKRGVVTAAKASVSPARPKFNSSPVLSQRTSPHSSHHSRSCRSPSRSPRDAPTSLQRQKRKPPLPVSAITTKPAI